MFAKLLSTLWLSALMAVPSNVDGKPDASSQSQASAGGTVERRDAPSASTGAGDTNPYSYCDSCLENHQRVRMESDVFVPEGVADYVPMQGADYRRDIATLAADGLALGLKRKSCVHRHEKKVQKAAVDPSATIDPTTTIDPYTSGPPPPLPITTMTTSMRLHSCAAAADRIRRCHVNEDGDGHFSEVGGMLFYDTEHRSTASYSYVFVPCAYVPFLRDLTWASAERFKQDHAALTLSCTGRHDKIKYPREYDDFVCKPAKPSKPE